MIYLGDQIKQYLEAYSEVINVEVDITEVDKDHIHILLCINSLDFNLEKWIIGFKRYSTYNLYNHSNTKVLRFLKNHYWYKNKFWSSGAFATSIGNVSHETVKKYIESQG